jgi:hypothetical protein
MVKLLQLWAFEFGFPSFGLFHPQRIQATLAVKRKPFVYLSAIKSQGFDDNLWTFTRFDTLHGPNTDFF